MAAGRGNLGINQLRGFATFGACIVLLGAAPAFADAPTPVRVTLPRATSWRATIELPAAIEAEQSATLAAERPGRVIAVLYRSGQTVATGTKLVTLDDAAETAQLDVDTAKLTQSIRNMARVQKLLGIAGASQAALEQAQADTAEAKAQLALDQAALAQLNITAPFAGTLGIRKLSAGDYVNQGQVVAEITQAAPLRVLFSVPQTQAGGLAVGDGFTLAAAGAPGSNIAAGGHITALSPMVEATTNARDGEGAITQNAAALLPGMQGTITLQTGTPQPAYLIPATALNDSVLGRYVFALQPAGASYTLQTIYITQYGQQGDNVVIATTGLNADEKIVAIGGFKLQDGAAVTPEGSGGGQ